MEIEEDKAEGLLEKLKNGHYSKVTVSELRGYLKEKGESTVGKKDLLIQKVMDLE